MPRLLSLALVVALWVIAPAATAGPCDDLCARAPECGSSRRASGGGGSRSDGTADDQPAREGGGDGEATDPADELPEGGGEADDAEADDAEADDAEADDAEAVDACLAACAALEAVAPDTAAEAGRCAVESEDCDDLREGCLARLELPACVTACGRMNECGELEAHACSSGSGGTSSSGGGEGEGEGDGEATDPVPDDGDPPREGGGEGEDEECEGDDTPPDELLAECVAQCSEVAAFDYADLATFAACIGAASCDAWEDECADEAEAVSGGSSSRQGGSGGGASQDPDDGAEGEAEGGPNVDLGGDDAAGGGGGGGGGSAARRETGGCSQAVSATSGQLLRAASGLLGRLRR